MVSPISQGRCSFLAPALAAYALTTWALSFPLWSRDPLLFPAVPFAFALHHATLRLWAWREEFGNEAAWSGELGRALAAGGAERLWPALTQD